MLGYLVTTIYRVAIMLLTNLMPFDAASYSSLLCTPPSTHRHPH